MGASGCRTSTRRMSWPCCCRTETRSGRPCGAAGNVSAPSCGGPLLKATGKTTRPVRPSGRRCPRTATRPPYPMPMSPTPSARCGGPAPTPTHAGVGEVSQFGLRKPRTLFRLGWSGRWFRRRWPRGQTPIAGVRRPWSGWWRFRLHIDPPLPCMLLRYTSGSIPCEWQEKSYHWSSRHVWKSRLIWTGRPCRPNFQHRGFPTRSGLDARTCSCRSR